MEAAFSQRCCEDLQAMSAMAVDRTAVRWSAWLGSQGIFDSGAKVQT